MNVMHQDQKEFEQIVAEVVQHVTNFYQGLEDRCVSIPYYEMPKNELSELGMGASAALKYFTQHYAKGLSGSVGSRYLGFVTGALHRHLL